MQYKHILYTGGVTMKALVVYDGSLNSRTALKYGIQKVKDAGGELIVLHVFNSSMFIGYDATPDAEKMARVESARYVEDARNILEETGAGTPSRIVIEEGNPVDEIIRYATAEYVDIIFSPPSCRAIAKNAPCPVSIIPGYILVPLDNTDITAAALQRITEEAKATGSKVILLGIVPIHIYSKWEKKELEKVKRETAVLLKRVKKLLDEKQVETKETIRSGYPDEEIAKVADDYPLSMIIVPAGGNEPSELSKAAAILSDSESGLTNNPLILLHESS
jgi:nucleotide-binding universal stress UspA family protein